MHSVLGPVTKIVLGVMSLFVCHKYELLMGNKLLIMLLPTLLPLKAQFFIFLKIQISGDEITVFFF